jgi:hypothetical protein
MGVAFLCAALLQPATLPWLILRPARDARSAELARFDERMDEHLVERLNATPELGRRMGVSRASIASMLDSGAPFASLHFDPTKSQNFTQEEKEALEDYILRGGFLLLIEDDYPYLEEEYRASADGTTFDFFFRELPARNPDFSVSRAEPDHPVFTQHYPIEIPPFIRREMAENASYRGETLLYHRGRLVAYTFALFAFHDDEERHVPLRRPFRTYDLILTGYEVLVNLYLYTSQH